VWSATVGELNLTSDTFDHYHKIMLKKYLEDRIVRQILAELLVNLSAGWITAAFIVPSLSGRSLIITFTTLIIDVFLSILALILSYKLRKKK
jgi:hypothetical protein